MRFENQLEKIIICYIHCVQKVFLQMAQYGLFERTVGTHMCHLLFSGLCIAPEILKCQSVFL